MKRCLVDFNPGKTQLVSFYWSDNSGAIDVKVDGSVLEKKKSFSMLGLIFLRNWIGALLLKLPPRKLKLCLFAL